LGKRASLSAIYFHLGPGEVKRPRCAPTRLAGGGPDRSAARSAAGESSAAVGDAGRARFFRACAGCGGGGRSANLEQSTGDCGVRQSTCRWCSQGEGRINPQRPLQCLCVYVSWLRELFGAFQNCSAREGVERNDGALPSKRSTTQDLPMPPPPILPRPPQPPKSRGVASPSPARAPSSHREVPRGVETRTATNARRFYICWAGVCGKGADRSRKIRTRTHEHGVLDRILLSNEVYRGLSWLWSRAAPRGLLGSYV
jgi:hypothetical protein